MKTYVDANVLVRLHLSLPGRQAAITFLEAEGGSDSGPIPITDLLRFEFKNAIERMVFESRSGRQWRVTPEAAALAQTDFALSLESGNILRNVPLALAQIEREFDSLAARHTAAHGFRTYDLIHVASAVTSRCRRFLSFDAKANALARLVGLETM